MIIHHAADSIQATFGPLAGITQLFKHHGRFGVNIFFGISGFLICSRLVYEEQRFGRIDLRGFYIRRLFRIIPPLLLFLTVVGVLGLHGILPIRLGQWFSALFFFANYYKGGTWYLGHFWSLAVEEHFYLLWPTLLVLVGSRRGRWLALGLAIAVGLWRSADMWLHIAPAEPNLRARTDTQMDGLLYGCLIAILYMDVRWRAKLTRWMTGWPTIVLLVLVVSPFRVGPWYVTQILATVFRAAAIPLIVVGTVLRPHGWLGKILELAPLRWIGRLSYSLYIWQQVFLAWDAFRSPQMGILQNIPLNLVCAFACAIASYHLIEKPLVKMGGNVAKRLAARRAAVPRSILACAAAKAGTQGS